MLWRHPNLLSGDYTLFWYESETDQVPKGHQALPVGLYKVNMPKKRRKGYDHCFRIDLQGVDGAEGRKFILAAKSDDVEGEEKLKMWQDALKKIETDSKAELAAAKLKANLATARAKGRVISALGGDSVRPLRCVGPVAPAAHLRRVCRSNFSMCTEGRRPGRPGSCRARDAAAR